MFGNLPGSVTYGFTGGSLKRTSSMRYFSPILLLMMLLAAPLALAEVSFHNDVMAVLSKAGCNAGACHGNKTGKGGFKLSLRGQDPEQDYLVLTRDTFARRTNPIDPDQS